MCHSYPTKAFLRKRLGTWLLTGLLTSQGMLLAQPVPVKDIFPGSSPSGVASTSTIVLNNMLYFAATDGVNGTELWKSDGTTAGTVLVANINPGAASSNPANFTEMNGMLYFTANNGTGGSELYKSNGTAAGTVLVKDINPGTGGAFPAYLTNVNGTLFFAASDGTTGTELWKSDGTAAGTVLVKDLAVGPSSFFDSSTSFSPGSLVNVSGTLFFSPGFTHGSVSTYGLYKSDGTAAGTVLVKNIPAFYLTALNGEAYFMNQPGQYASVLWKSDGTDAGTVAVKTFREPGPSGFDRFYFIKNVNGTLYFANQVVPSASMANIYLWKSDGTTVGTVATNLGFVHRTSNLVTYEFMGDYFYYSISGGTATFLDIELMRVPLTGGNPQLVKDIFPGSAGGTPNKSAPTNMKAVGTTLYFGADNGANGRELWKSDGTNAGTTLVADINPAGSANPVPLAGINNVLLFAADNGATGQELWQYDPNPVTPPGGLTFRVNAGGEEYTTIDGRTYSGDAYVEGGNPAAVSGTDIVGTDDDYLYENERYGADFTYQLPTGKGSYDVVLHFAETYWGAQAQGGIGSRRFNVDIENERKLTQYDVFERAGGAMSAVQETFQVVVTDGVLSIRFTQGSADLASVKAIEVLPAGSFLRLNAGGGTYQSLSGKTFASDVYFAHGTVSAPVGGEIANTAEDALYSTQRYGSSFSYGLPTGNGSYEVVLHFAETYWGHQTSGGVGSRKFNVYIEGEEKLSEYDIFEKAGGAMIAVQERFLVTVSDGVLNFYFSAGSADNATIAALEVSPASASARRSQQSPALEAHFTASLFPNPVEDQFEVAIDLPVSQVRSTSISSASGTTLQVNSHKIVGDKQLGFQVSQLKAGLYLLKLDTKAGSKVLKFVKK